MTYTIWQTPHYINHAVTEAFAEGIKNISVTKEGFPIKAIAEFKKGEVRPCISYGILRGSGFIMQACRDQGIEFWEIDRGYFGAKHFDGYYRISMGGMTPEYVPDVCNDTRFKALGLEIKPWRSGGKHILFCPPTKWVRWFYDLPAHWEQEVIGKLKRKYIGKEIRTRDKSHVVPLEQDLEDCHLVVTHSSNVAVEALLAGVPAICLGRHPVGDGKINREKLFNFLAWQQFTLDEIKQGWPWEAVQCVQKYKSVYVGQG